MAYRRYSSYSTEEKIKAFRFTTCLWAVMAIAFFYLSLEIGVIAIFFGLCMVLATVLSFKEYKYLKENEEKKKKDKEKNT